ncbi:putative dNA gyrase subunit B [Vibrio parahaemolyticus VPTS-2010_2]|nr:putative dNA gyrase subunit B [Vibrio parahaemolyticus VPTS-2010_2]
MLCVFAFSLKQPQSIIERLARLQEPELPPSGVAYTRKVTMVWCVFFVLNAAFALYTCFLPVKIWTLYNGLISYLLAGSLFAGEWIVRQFVRKEH